MFRPFQSFLSRMLTASLAALAISETGLAQVFDFSAEDGAALNTAIEAGAYGTVTSIVILHEGEIAHEGYFNGAEASTLHNTRSVTKTLTAYAVGAAIADGHLSLETRIASLFEDYADEIATDPRKSEITVEDLLTMSSILECDDWNPMSRGNEERMYIVEDWTGFFWSLPVRGYPSWATPPGEAAYGRAFSYCTAGVQLLGETVERAVGEDFISWSEERIFSPLGIDRLDWPLNGNGDPHMGGGLGLESRALARLGEVQRLGGETILPRSWTEASITPRAQIPNTPGFEYGYLWWLMPYEVAGERYWAAAMNGNGGNRVMVLADFGLTVVFTNTDYNTQGMHENAARFFAEQVVARIGE
ncbi:MAG: serine hydrolase [Alphaproteobacteria bacterium]|nr:serine hydrolase [Alphaproteobacteria bacterium]